MKASPDTLLTIIVSIATATITGAGTLIWWVSGLQNRVKNTEKDVEEMKEDYKESRIKTNQHSTDIAVIMSRLDTIIELLKKK